MPGQGLKGTSHEQLVIETVGKEAERHRFTFLEGLEGVLSLWRCLRVVLPVKYSLPAHFCVLVSPGHCGLPAPARGEPPLILGEEQTDPECLCNICGIC